MMQSEGPYKFKDRLKYAATVGPGIPDGEEYFDISPEVANMIYAEGRKAAENDFKELLDIANRMVAPSGPKFQAVTDFMFWKKARGIK